MIQTWHETSLVAPFRSFPDPRPRNGGAAQDRDRRSGRGGFAAWEAFVCRP